MFRKIETRTGLIIIFAAVVILFGGALTYYYKMAPTTYDYEVQSFSTVQKTATVDVMKDWKTYTNSDYGFSFKYPKDWEYNVSSDNTNVDGKKYKTFVSFRPSTTLKEDFLGSVAVELDTMANSIVTVKKTLASNSTFISKSIEQISGYDATKLSFRNNSDRSILPTQYLLEKNNLIYILSGEGSTGSVENEKIIRKIIFSFLFTSIDNTAVTATSATTPATTSASLTYNNTTYGFNLTLPSSWSGYKVKATKVEGELDTYYFEMPTNDPLNAQATSTADAGYASAFAIGVMEKSQWNGGEDQVRDFGSKVGENDNYVFTASYAQASPTDWSAAISAAVKTIIDSFKLN